MVSSYGLGYLISALKGEIAIEKVVSALQQFKKDGIIKDFGQTLQFGQDDRSGIDIFIFPFKGKVIELQVKASGNERTAARYERRGKHFIAAPPIISEEEVKTKLLQILRKARGLRKS